MDPKPDPPTQPRAKRRKQGALVEWLASLSAEEVLRRLRHSGKEGLYAHERTWVLENAHRWPEIAADLCEQRDALAAAEHAARERRAARNALQSKCLLGGATGELRCACGNPRYPGRSLCPQCAFGDDFDPIAHAQAATRAELVRAGKADPREVGRLAALALNHARWLVEQGIVGWPLAYQRAARRYGVSETAIRRLGSQRAARTRSFTTADDTDW